MTAAATSATPPTGGQFGLHVVERGIQFDTRFAMYRGRKNASQPVNTSGSCSVPAEAGTGTECLGDSRLGPQRSGRHQECRRYAEAVQDRPVRKPVPETARRCRLAAS